MSEQGFQIDMAVLADCYEIAFAEERAEWGDIWEGTVADGLEP